MRCVHVILAVHVSYGLAHFVHLKSMTPFELPARTTGCSSTSIKVCYECTRELTDTADLPQVPQLFSFRVDCRGAKGDFQNITLFDSSLVCAHLTYRKYGNSSVRNPTSQWLPLISDRIVTVEKGDVLDFQCVFRRLKIYHGLGPERPERTALQLSRKRAGGGLFHPELRYGFGRRGRAPDVLHAAHC